MDSPGDAAVAERRLRTERRPQPPTRAQPAVRVIPPRPARTQNDPHHLKNPAPDIHPQLSWREFLGAYFSREICPVLTPLAFDPGHPFPLISNLSKNFAVVVRHGNRTKFARVKLPDVLPRFIQLPETLSAGDGQTFVFLEDVIHANMQELFPGTQVKSAHLFRVIRDADLEIEPDEADDLLETVDRSLKQLRHGAIALLQVDAPMPARVLNILAENFEVTEEVIVRTAHRVGFGDWMQLTKIHRPELKYPPFSPRSLWRLDEDPEVLFDQLRYQIVLVHHPY